jgi:hypothetical protein
LPFAPDAIPASILSATPAEFVGRCHVHEGYRLEGRLPAYAPFFAARPADPPLWVSDDGLHSVCAIDDPEFVMPETVVLPGPGCLPPTAVLLRAADRTVGFYVAGMAWIDPGHRGRGLSPMMILSACVLVGGFAHDVSTTMGYSAAGHAAHLAAHRAARRIAGGAAEEMAA